MLAFFKMHKTPAEPPLTWDEQASASLNQALSQAPVPALLKGKVKKELMDAAEEAARSAGHTTVTAQDVMQGLLAKLPGDMRAKVENAIKKGDPSSLQSLQDDLQS